MFVMMGCLPVVDFRSPIIRGRVVDSRTGRPVPNALIMLRKYSEVAVRSSKDGDFELPAKRNVSWCVLGYPDHCFIRQGQDAVLVFAPGYREQAIHFLTPAPFGKELMATIELVRQ